MSQATPYERKYDLTNDDGQDLRTQLDIELDDVVRCFLETLTNLALIQRDDGQLANKSVGVEQLKAELIAGFNPPEPFQPFRLYEVSDSFVTDDGKWYIVNTSFVATDDAQDNAGDITLVYDFATVRTDSIAAKDAAEAAQVAAELARDQAQSAATSASQDATQTGQDREAAANSASSAASSASSASNSANASAASASNAANAEQAAEAAEAKAELWADEDENVEVETGRYSARHWAQKAAELGGDPNQFQVTTSTGTQTLVEAFNARAVKPSNVRLASFETGFIDSVDADNTQAAVDLLSSAQDGDVIDFGGKMWRIYPAVTGIASSTATPATDQAVAITSVPRLIGKKNITIRNGGLYVGNQGTAPEKRYFPSTVYFQECDNITFDNAVFESKGESYGDSDAALGLSFNDRMEFVAVNGGHAVCMARCSNVRGRVTTRLAGSAASFYCPSCYNVHLSDSFSNPASLGYAGYNLDSWVGGTAETGFPEHSLYLSNCSSYAETLFRREDGTTAVGSSVWASKNGVLTEDIACHVNIVGGFWADAYQNELGSGPNQGSAFHATSACLHASDARVARVAFAGTTHTSSDEPATLVLDNIVGTVGAAVYASYNSALNSQAATLNNCTIHVDGSRLGIVPYTTSAYIVSRNVNTAHYVTVRGCKFTGATLLALRPSGAVSYGGLLIEGGEYTTNGHLCDISGWGGAAADSNKGFVITGGARVRDRSNVNDNYIKFSNYDGGSVYCFIFFDVRNCFMSAEMEREIGRPIDATGGGLEERAWLPSDIKGLYSISSPGYPYEQRIMYLSNSGYAGDTTIASFACLGRYGLLMPAICAGKNAALLRFASPNSGPSYNSAQGRVEVSAFLSGQLTEGVELVVGAEYTILGR